MKVDSYFTIGGYCLKIKDEDIYFTVKAIPNKHLVQGSVHEIAPNNELYADWEIDTGQMGK